MPIDYDWAMEVDISKKRQRNNLTKLDSAMQMDTTKTH